MYSSHFLCIVKILVFILFFLIIIMKQLKQNLFQSLAISQLCNWSKRLEFVMINDADTIRHAGLY